MNDLYDLTGDLRFSLRQLAKTPGFALAAVACIALGIGANTATFSFAKTLLFSMPPVEEPERLVRLFIKWSSGLDFGSFSYPDYLDLRERSDVFDGVVASSMRPVHLATGDSTERVAASIVSANYFSELGVGMALGRGFGPEVDETPGGHPVVVISHGLWQRRFGGDRDVVGRSLVINGHRFDIVGVAPEEFYGTIPAVGIDLWAPITMQAQLIPGRDLLEARGNHWINFVTARLKPDVTLEQARQSTNALLASLAQEYPDSNTGKSIDIYPESEAAPHPSMRRGFVAFMGLMFAVVGFVMLLACANVAGLLLSRHLARRREMGLRLALGATRGRLLRQLGVESATLAALGGVAGLALAWALIRTLQGFEPPTDLPLRLDVNLDPTVLSFTLAVSLLCGLLFGVVPSLQSTRLDLTPALRDGARSTGTGTSWLRSSLVVGQVAISFVLLIGAGLVVHSLQNARNLDPGFDPDHALMATVDLDLQGYDEVTGRAFQEALREAVAALPGVTAVGLAEVFPLNFSSQQTGSVPEGFVPAEGSDNPSIDYNIVDQGYFDAMGIPILQGRGIRDTDDADAPPVLVVNQAFADRFWPNEVAVGKRVETRGADHEVVGIVPTGKYQTLGEDPKPYMYYSAFQAYRGETTLHVRVAGDPDALVGAVRAEVARLDPSLPVTELKSLHAALGFALLPARMAAGVVSVFALLALLLAAIGLYGVVSYGVSQSTRDIGVRVALGAGPREILRFVIAGGFRLTLVGLVTGLVAGIGLSRFVGSLLYGLSTTDPIAYASALVLLVSVALVASFLPARRATRVDPIRALRAD